MSARIALSSLIVISAVAATVLWLRPNEQAPVEVTPHAVPDAPTPAPSNAPVMTYEAPKIVRDPKPEERERMFKLPNGEFVASLNGVLNAADMLWPTEIPFSPIVGRERDAHGHEWYVHADGSKSTNRMVFRSDLGRMDPITTVANPTAPLPMEPSEPGAPKGETAENAKGGAPGAGGVRK